MEDGTMPKKTIKLKFEIDEETGKIGKVTGDKDSPGDTNGPVGTITDSVSIVVTRKNPTCFNILINNVWHTFCY
jgi:hypothetical protein